MLINKRNLAVLGATSKEESRYTLQAVCLIMPLRADIEPKYKTGDADKGGKPVNVKGGTQ